MSVLVLAIGGLLMVGGTAAITWLIADAVAVRPARRRADRAEEALQRLRAQRRQHRGVVVAPGLLEAADAVLADAGDDLLRREVDSNG